MLACPLCGISHKRYPRKCDNIVKNNYYMFIVTAVAFGFNSETYPKERLTEYDKYCINLNKLMNEYLKNF